LFLLSVSAQSVSAQNNNAALKLFTGRAVIKAHQRAAQSRTQTFFEGGASGAEFVDNALSGSFKAGGMENIFLSSRKETSLLFDYRVFMQLDSGRSTMNRDDLYDQSELSSFAQSLFTYQSAKTAADAVLRSDLEPVYRKMVKRVRWVADFATLQLVQGSSGDLGVSHGAVPRGEKLIEFRLQLTTRSGLEPRIRVGRNLVMRYDALHGDALLEYQRDF